MSTPALETLKSALMEAQARRSRQLPGNSSLAKNWFNYCQQADMRWQNDGLPTRKDESWKYTSLTSITESSLVVAAATLPSELPKIALAPKLDGQFSMRLTFYNGQWIPELSEGVAHTGVTISPLSQILAKEDTDSKALWQRLEKLIKTSSEAVLSDLNTSFSHDTWIIKVDRSYKNSNPILISSVSGTSGRQKSTELPTSFPRIFVWLQSNSSAAIVEHHTYLGAGRTLTISHSHFAVESGAKLSFAMLSDLGEEGSHLGHWRFDLARDSFAEVAHINLGSLLARNETQVILSEPGAGARLDGLYLADRDQHVDNHTNIEHRVEHTTSEQLYKGILSGQSRAVFNGRILIEKKAQRSSDSQMNRTLLLSPKAEIDTKPELAIFADDVKAAHGASISRLDQEQIYYLQTRAISKEESIRMLSLGFAEDVAMRLGGAMQKILRAPIAAKMVEMQKARL